MKDKSKYYEVGALLYCPANNKGIVQKLLNNEFGDKFSLALCLEDTINDNKVAEAEQILIDSLQHLLRAIEDGADFYLPKIFIRVRRSEQITDLDARLGAAGRLVHGFCIPKICPKNAVKYVEAIKAVNSMQESNYSIMPILESDELLDLRTRYEYLYRVKEHLDSIEPWVLNVRVGGNDLSHAFGLRRHSYETIWDVKPVASVLTDVLTVYSRDYVVSGPVWEYYNGENWDLGMINEIRKDVTAGFVGKTVIHPKQISVLNKASAVLKEDLEDAKAILQWDENANSMVSGSNLKSRMNEYKTHSNWAQRIMMMANYYGVR